jgi:hypothetical protein
MTENRTIQVSVSKLNSKVDRVSKAHRMSLKPTLFTVMPRPKKIKRSLTTKSMVALFLF